MPTYNGHLFILMAPTGSGKGTLVKAARAQFAHLHIPVSCTTRAMRPGETAGVDYHYIGAEEFARRVEAGEFLEWANFGGNRYGTLVSEVVPYLTRGDLVLAELELQGVERLRQLIPPQNLTVVYLEGGDWEVLKARALARSPMTEAELAKRYERYRHEIEAKPIADVIIDNTAPDPAPAIAEFITLLESKSHHFPDEV